MTYPTTPGFQSATIIDNERVLVSEAGNLRVQARSLNAQRWEFEAVHPPMTRANAAAIMAFIKAQRGRSTAFTVTLPVYSDARGTASGTVLTNGSHSPGDTEISIDGITGTLLPGDFVVFQGHTKAYMVTEERSGDGILTIYPSLRENVANNSTVTYDSVPFTVRLGDNRQSYQASNDGLVRTSVYFIEVV